ncbi:hypothetical protein R1flu_000437 [Riccia fluitans]|uniref:Uncharacterized protein n=1 Tax=Riccia fluitans TaxID=41844 RepID=A0ABD1Y0H5_9MARC
MPIARAQRAANALSQTRGPVSLVRGIVSVGTLLPARASIGDGSQPEGVNGLHVVLVLPRFRRSYRVPATTFLTTSDRVYILSCKSQFVFHLWVRDPMAAQFYPSSPYAMWPPRRAK